MRNSVASIGLLVVLLLGNQGSAQRLPAFQAGVSDRANFEQWIAAQSGAYRAGADYWVAHRSLPREAHCIGRGDQLQGCVEAQHRLAPLDARRKAEPEYRLGWNGTAPVTADQNPSSASGQVPPERLPDPVQAASTSNSLIILITLLLAVAITVVFVNSRFARMKRRRAVRIAFAEIKAKSHLLHIRREQMTQPDFYGTRDLKKWEIEKVNFVKTRIAPLLDSQGTARFMAKIEPIILAEIEAAACRPIEPGTPASVSNPAVYNPGMDPVHYEMYCAAQLRKAGWATKPTPTTGDQGADIHAEREGVTLVVQCKLYSGSVGNTAVQEVLAGRMFYRADLAIVVSNARFTRSARDLAGISKVALLHHSQLSAYTGDTDPMQLRAVAD